MVLWAGAALGLLAVAAAVAVTFFGFSFLVFRSGSMAPEIPTGGLALSRTVAAEDLRAGDVVSVTAGNGERITHRVVSTTLRGGEATLVLQGDANGAPDTEVYVVRSADRVVASVPYGGYVVAHALTPPGLLAMTCLSLMLLVMGWSTDEDEEDDERAEDEEDDERAEDDEDDEDPISEDDHRPRARHRQAVSAGAVLLSVVLGGVAAASTSGTLAKFTDPAKQSGTFSAAEYFTCDAAIRGVANPYFYWKLNETSGTTANDTTSNNRDGLLVNSPAGGAARACTRDTGTAMTFNGSDELIGQPSGRSAVQGPNTFTLSLWFRTTTSSGGKLIGFGNQRETTSSQYDRHIYMTNAGRLVFGVRPSAVRTVTSPATYRDGAWHHVAATLSGAGMRLYVDGTLVVSRTDTTSAQSYSGFWRVGFDNLDTWDTIPSSRYFAGTIDEVAVYLSARSASDIAQLNMAGR